MNAGKKINKKDEKPKKPELAVVQKWVNIYGCNPDYDNSTAKEQNEDIEKATCFKGRVLVEYTMEDMQAPIMKVNDLTTEIKEKSKHKFKIYAQIDQGILLPECEDYKIKIMVGE